MLDGKLPQKLTLGGRFNVLVGYEMVGDKGNPRHVIKLFGTRLAEPLNGNGRSNIVGEGEVNTDFNEFSRFYFVQAGVGRKNFFSNRHSHGSYLCHWSFIIGHLPLITEVSAVTGDTNKQLALL